MVSGYKYFTQYLCEDMNSLRQNKKRDCAEKLKNYKSLRSIKAFPLSEALFFLYNKLIYFEGSPFLGKHIFI